MIAHVRTARVERPAPRCSSSFFVFAAVFAALSGAAGCGSSATPAKESASSSSAGSSAADAAPDGSIARSSTGCGQGTSCMPGTDLAAPDEADGYQIVTPPMAIAVAPGDEVFMCYYKTLPTSAEVDIGEFQSWMTPGSSHHFIAYQVGAGSSSQLGINFPSQPDGTLESCSFGGGTWLYATSLAGEIIEMQMPAGVGLPMPAAAQVMLNMHFINPSATTAYPQVKLNLLYAKNIQYKAEAMVSFNTSINVPAATASGPGMQTVSGTCTASAGSNFFAMTTHTHKHGVNTTISYTSGGQTTQLVDTTDWEHPDVAVWTAPNFLTTKSGDSFGYSCSYVNTGATAVTVGETAASNEMCMAIGYYFPAATWSCN
jgi:Copper type II ascorbate-dependent monooxygenase, C-terminal domain